MQNQNVETFYRRPYSPLTYSAIISLMLVSYLIFKIAALYASSEVATFLGIICMCELGLVLALSWVAITTDPDASFAWKRKTRGNNNNNSREGNGAASGGGARSYKVRRPLIGYKSLKYCVDTPEGMENVWYDGVRYERAAFEFWSGRIYLALLVNVSF